MYPCIIDSREPGSSNPEAWGPRWGPPPAPPPLFPLWAPGVAPPPAAYSGSPRAAAHTIRTAALGGRGKKIRDAERECASRRGTPGQGPSGGWGCGWGRKAGQYSPRARAQTYEEVESGGHHPKSRAWDVQSTEGSPSR